MGTDIDYFASTGFEVIDRKDPNPYTLWVVMFSYTATCATIVSGSLAERTQLPAYMAFSLFMTGFIFPCVVSWTWGGGWLGEGDGSGTTMGMHDFSGSGVVHMTGGFSGLIGAYMVGPRYGRE